MNIELIKDFLYKKESLYIYDYKLSQTFIDDEKMLITYSSFKLTDSRTFLIFKNDYEEDYYKDQFKYIDEENIFSYSKIISDLRIKNIDKILNN